MIVHKIHQSAIVGLGRHGQSLRLFTYQLLLGLDSQVQFKLSIDPVDPLVVPSKSFDLAQVKEAEAKALVPLAVGNTQQPICNKLVFIGQHGVIAITVFADFEDVAG